jgi:hypothetical protein
MGLEMIIKFLEDVEVLFYDFSFVFFFVTWYFFSFRMTIFFNFDLLLSRKIEKIILDFSLVFGSFFLISFLK